MKEKTETNQKVHRIASRKKTTVDIVSQATLEQPYLDVDENNFDAM